ncbi:hypothetical protein [Ponticoccus alexandrii]|uniref:Uncharacterized protein n=1 Tax=Ponticoccus alexandrii TaxID=1943633 RepID=A0ABX7FAF5_9RHOB|nr:hypothetical protein [Ponticoccus alexandrii]ETA53049.1 hypothetical protein P279_05405 [Rhodobacteraceae bacterium PD-2]QRF66787.1 hypothetical protein GQA70_10985 [Ponticoccus alexandrii]
MSDLKTAILDAKYIDMIELGDFVVRDTGLPDVDSDGNLMPQATEIAAALFRWAADVQAAEARKSAKASDAPAQPELEAQQPMQAPGASTGFQDYDANGDPQTDSQGAGYPGPQMQDPPQSQGGY